MNKIQLALMTVATGFALQSQAALYDISFTGGGWSASGRIDVVNNSATSGFLNVTFNGTTVNYNNLAVSSVGTTVRNNNGDDLPYGNTDNYVSPTATPFLDENGLLFLTAPIIGGHTAGAGIYLSIDQFSADPAHTYNLNGYGNSPGFGWGVPNVDGIAIISLTPVPEPTTLIAGGLLLLPFGAITFRTLRRSRTV